MAGSEEAIKKPLTFIEAVCRRPKMYTMNGTLGEVVAFLEGFYSGASRSNPTVGAEWSGFTAWLRTQYQTTDDRDWYIAVRDSYTDDAAALEGLSNLFARYKAETDIPVAEMNSVEPATGQKRPFGLCAGEFTVPDDFDEPLS